MRADTLKLRKAFQFFLEHAGYCTPPGRAACALALARAEAEAKARGLIARWQDTPDAWDGDGPTPEGCAEACLIYSSYVCETCGERPTMALESLWGIWGADADYRRVVEAELFAEALTR